MSKQLSLFGVQYEEPKKEVTYKEFTYGSAFAGIGGMTMGLEGLGGKCVKAWEFDPTSKRQYAQEAHRLLHPHISVEGDICKFNTDELVEFDVLCFTPPCQSFSTAGKRGGFEDTRGTLTFEALRIAKDGQPKALFMENVKGLVNHDKGNTMGVIINAINEIGFTVDLTVINSKYFDVAQNRERVYLIAIRNDLITPEPWDNIKGNTMLPKAKLKYLNEGARTFNFDWPEQKEVKTRLRDFLEQNVDEKYYLSEDKTNQLVNSLAANNYVNDGRVEQYTEGDGISCCIDANYAKGTSPGEVGKGRRTHVFSVNTGLSPTITTNKSEGVKFLGDYTAILDIRNKSADIKSGKSGIRVSYDICPTISATEQKDTKKIIESVDHIGSCDPEKLRSNGKPKYLEEIRPVITPELLEKRQNERRFKDDGEESFTITTIDRHGVAIGNYLKYRIRKLTPKECLRLQSVSEENIDKLLKNFSDSRCYKFAGNGLTTNVIKAIGQKLLKYL